MYSSINLADIKANARGRLQGQYMQVIFVTISYFLFVLFLEACNEMFNHDTSILSFSIGIIASYIISAINMKYKISLHGYFLELASGKTPNMNTVFAGFIKDGGSKTYLAMILALLQQICYFPAYIMVFIFDSSNSLHLLLYAGSLALGIILNIIIDIRLLPASFLVNDIRNITHIKCLLTALWLTKKKGYKIFLLKLSFVPLYLLGFLSCGVGLLFVYPYMVTSDACLYLSLCSTKEEDN